MEERMSEKRQGFLFDLPESKFRKNDGMERAATNGAEDLATARSVAISLGLTKEFVTADDVGQELERLGYNSNLGPAAGSLFKTDDWQFTGKRILSKRVTNHARELKAWRLRR